MTRISVAALLTGLPAIAGNTSSTPATFNKDVLPILKKNCHGCDHAGKAIKAGVPTNKECAE